MEPLVAATVRDALAAHRAVVAVETSVFAHGDAAALVASVQNAIREHGATPALVGALEGRVRVGLEGPELEAVLAEAGNKIGIWNLPAALAKGQTGGTTVATTAHVARLVGIEVLATGGIGGVHHDPFDESADLLALARTPVVVVSSGPKIILNLPATLERLETLGVPVVGYNTDHLPALYSPRSPYRVPSRLDTPNEIAQAQRQARALHLPQALLVVNPVAEGLDFLEVQRGVEQIGVEARRAGVSGKALTPFLLGGIAQRFGTRPARIAERALHENAALAAGVATAMLGAG